MTQPLVGPPLPAPPVGDLVEAIERLGDRREPWLTVHAGQTREALTGAEVLGLAQGWAGALREAGVARGDRVAVLLPNDARFVGAFFGALLLGAVPVPLAWPFSLGNAKKALEHLAPLVQTAAPVALATTPALDDACEWPIPRVVEPGHPRRFGASVGPEHPAWLQFTSGSIGRPRGAEISHRAALASAWSMGLAMGVGPSDVGVSWLPLFHDMGLVGALLCPLVHGFPLHLMAPAEFLLHPRRWLQRITEVGGTVAAAPDFAYALLARRVRDVAGLDLSTFRHALDGAEPVHRATIEAFAERFGPAGFRREALTPVYGLAENTLGAAFADPAVPAPDLDWQGRAIPSVGRPLPGMEVGVWRDGWVDGEEGEIRVRGPALMSGYFRDPASTAGALDGGWLRTGDLGVIREGRLYVTGREKDLVIQNGTKFHPYDIERVAAELVQAPPNGAAAFSTPGADGTERLVVVVEVRGDGAEVDRTLRGGLMEALGVRPDRVVAVGPGEIPRTTSGKVRRRECAARWADVSAAGADA